MYIVGGPGSGKTTLSNKLASIIDAPVYELDQIGYENGAGAKRTLVDKLKDVDAVAESDAWIAEGVFLWWTEKLLDRADVIVWLDVSWRVAWWRIISRHVKASISGTNNHRGLGKLRFFLRNSKRYYQDTETTPHAMDDDSAVTRSATEAELARHKSKVVHCASRRDVAAFLRSM